MSDEKSKQGERAAGQTGRAERAGEKRARESRPLEAPPKTSGDEASEDRFPIVAIGASAGGLSALRQLFSRVPSDSGLAFVVVMHLSPEHESHLEQLLQPHVKMPVQQVTETVALERNRVFVIPPNANLDAIDTHLRLTELEKNARGRAPVDHFFRTLSETHDGDAVGVILSGTGSDGTLGLRQIKERGGLTIVQDPGEAEYDGMPQSAIAAAPVDLILPVAEIPEAVLRFMKIKPQLRVPEDTSEAAELAQRFLHKVFALLRARTGRDFSYYKRSTMLRRVSRRMQFNHVAKPQRYLDLLRKRPEEARALADDLLITVTNFFRDREVFEALEKSVIPSLFRNKGAGDSLRVWSVGCATGEEAYSLAMLLLEEAQRRDTPPSIQVFASDLHQASLAKAREGLYPGDIETDVGSGRLAAFFEKENGSYRVRKEVREHVVFAPHNVLSDPPFSRLDLISCRNLLIYLDRALHPMVSELFHYALREEGILVLGTSEGIEAGDLFRIEDKKNAVYRRRNVPAPEPRLPVFPLAQGRTPPELPRRGDAGNGPPAYGAMHQHIVEQQGPASVLLSPDNNVVHSSATAGRYLVHPGGPPTTSVFKLVREELRIELCAVLSAARRERRAIRTKPVTTRCEGESVQVELDVRPALSPKQEGFVLLVFDERPRQEGQRARTRPVAEGGEPAEQAQEMSRLREIEAEKLLAEQRLQELIEEHESSQEEIKASNEELQSANEELRSTLEELETSKEELQSMNEELQTVNQENRHKVEELDQLSSDLQNLLVATDIATLFLDREFRILRFTPKVSHLFSIKTADRGRALSDFTTRLGYDGLCRDARRVIEQLVPVEREVQDEAGRWYLTRILPYRDSQDRIAGVVLTFVDITSLKRAEEEVRRARDTSEKIIESLPEPLLVLTPELSVRSANASFYEHFHVEPDETLGRKVYDLGNRQWNIPKLRDLLERILPDKQEFAGYEVDHVFDGLGRRVMLLNGRRLDSSNLILLGIHDMTERFEADLALRQSEERFRALTTASSEVLYRMSPDWAEMRQLRSRGFLASTDEPTTSWLDAYVPPEDQARVTEAVEHAKETGKVFELEHRVLRADGSVGWISSRAVPLFDDRGEIVEWFGAASDVTQRRQYEEKLRESDRRKDDYLAMLGHELRNPLGAIHGAAELLRSSELEDERLRRAVGVLRRQSDHMAHIVDGLLDVSRIIHGKVHLSREPVDIRRIVEEVLDLRTAHSDTLAFEIKSDFAPEPLWVLGDQVRLAQVFDNLVGNAIKFTQAPGTISVHVRREDASAVVRVRDTGIGIRPEILSGIFEAFQQENQDMARDNGGLGIGLSLVKGLVDLHEGVVEAYSAGPGTGAEFVVRLPLTSPLGEEHDEDPGHDAASLRILVVEDNPDAAEMLRALLEVAGHDVIVAHTGKAALDVLRQRSVDAVLCDVGLPGMSGYDVARSVREDPTLHDVLLVAVTGYGQPEDRKRAAEAGFDEHLTKPANLKALTVALQKARSDAS